MQLVGALNGQTVLGADHLGPEQVEDLLDPVAGLVGGVGPVRDGDPAAGDGRRGQERRGVGQIRADDDVGRFDRSGADEPAVGLGVVDLRPRVRAAARSSWRCWAGSAPGGPSCCNCRPPASRAPIISSPETNWLDAEASMVTAPPGRSERPVTVNGSPRHRSAELPSATDPIRAPAWPSPSSRPGHRSCGGGLVAGEFGLPVDQRGHRRQEPHHRAGQTAIDPATRGESGPAG